MIIKCSPQDQEQVLNYLKERFGIQRQLFDGFSFYSASKGRIYIGPKKLIEKPKPGLNVLSSIAFNTIYSS